MNTQQGQGECGLLTPNSEKLRPPETPQHRQGGDRVDPSPLKGRKKTAFDEASPTRRLRDPEHCFPFGPLGKWGVSLTEKLPGVLVGETLSKSREVGTRARSVPPTRGGR